MHKRNIKAILLVLATGILSTNSFTCSQEPLDSPPATGKKDSISRTDGTVLLINNQPFFARVIQHNGESFAFLKSLGFNTVQLAACATPRQLEEARSTGTWLICPPPSSVGLQPIPFNFDPVIGWTVSDNASARHLQLIRETRREVHASDRRIGRPVIATVASHCESIAKVVDVPVIGRPALNSSFPSRDYSDWIANRSRLVSKPFWVDLPTHFPTGLDRQALALSVNPPPLPLQHQQLKFLAYEAITGGGRGIRFLSRQRLDVVDPETELRAQTLRWLMKHLDQIESWISGGLVQQVQSTSQAEQIHQIRLPDSNLILVQRTTGWEQYVAGDVPARSLTIPNLRTSISDQAYSIDELGARLIPNQRNSTGVQLTFDQCSYTAAGMITQSPGPVAVVNQTVVNNPLQDRLRLTRQSHAMVHLIQQRLNQLGQSTTAEILGAISETDQQINNARQILTAGNQRQALEQLQRADAASALVRRKWLESRFDPASGITVSPLLMHVGLVPDSDVFSARLAMANWSPNALTAGDFENLRQMLDSGWTNRRADLSQVETQVTLDKSAAKDGRYGLKLTAKETAFLPIAPTPPVWIKSADVAVRKSQLVRIHGYVYVPDSIRGSGDGLIILDSLGGPDLASRIQKTTGWQEFTFYRAAQRDGQVNVTFLLTGFGSAMVDEVTIRTLDLSSSGVQAKQPNATIK